MCVRTTAPACERVSAVAAQTVRSDTVLFAMVCVCQYNKNIIYRRVQGVCLHVWAGDGLCLEFVCSVNAKKGKKTHLKNVCVCVCV